MTTNWHRFVETAEGDEQCSSCDCVVSIEAHLTFTLPCPVPPCSSRANPDTGCVFVPGRGEVAACIYCGHRGSRDGDAPPPDVEMDAMLADLVGDD